MAAILIVDDEYPVRALAAHHLRSTGHTVTEADSGLRALALLREISFDLLITDINMAQLDGFGLIACARQAEKTSQLPVLVLTSRNDRHTREQQEYFGANAMLLKPLDREALLRHVHALVPAPQEVSLPPTQAVTGGTAAQSAASSGASMFDTSELQQVTRTTAESAGLVAAHSLDQATATASNFWKEAALTARRAPVRRARRVYDDAHFPTLEGYDIESLLATGSSAALFKARHVATGARHALKVVALGAEDAITGCDAIERFAQEYHLTLRFSNPHIIKAYAQGFSDDFAYIAMELLDGGSLAQRIGLGLTADRAMELAAHIARALAVLHKEGVIHRDLKPANMLFRADGTLVLADFGASTAAADTLVATATGFAMGTPSYVSPEQAAGQGADSRSDLYAMGVIVYEMLTGEKPFRAKHPAEVIMQHRYQPVPDLPAHLMVAQPLINRLMAKDPAHRFGEAAEVLRWINAFWRQGGFQLGNGGGGLTGRQPGAPQQRVAA
jgi:CheY-like chemotaxis protein